MQEKNINKTQNINKNNNMKNEMILDCQNVTKVFTSSEISDPIEVLSGVNLTLYRGQQIAIMGRSGSGKTTLLQLLGGLENPSNGKIILAGFDLGNISEIDKSNLRNRKIGFIYQLHHLLTEFTVLENVYLPLLIGKIKLSKARELAKELLVDLGLSSRLNFYPNKLSGGEKQRVAIARALINNPGCILADEPTGNLDLESANIVMDVLSNLHVKYKVSVIMVTHDISLAKRFDKIYFLENGKLNAT